MSRWKSVIGLRLTSRSFSRQITEIQRGYKVLNTMTVLGCPAFDGPPYAAAWDRANSVSASNPCKTLRGDNRQHFPPLSERRVRPMMQGAL